MAAVDAHCVRPPKVVQVRYVPGRSVTVELSARIRWSDKSESAERFVAMSGMTLHEDCAVVAWGSTHIGLWRFPNDPYLPGLRSTFAAAGAEDLFEKLGFHGGDITVTRKAYRASRRAVLELKSPDHRVFVKIVRPANAEKIHRLHQRLSPIMVVPKSLGWSSTDGTVAIEAVSGQSLRTVIAEGARTLPEAHDLAELLDQLPPAGPDDAAVADPVERVDEHARFLGAVCPASTQGVAAVAARMGDVDLGGGELIHGDFHADQILTENGLVTGLVDIDTVGRGARIMDYASMLAQLSVLAERGQPGFAAYGQQLIAGFDRLVDPQQLRRRVAAVIVGLATGPFRVQERQWDVETEARVALAQSWVESADATP